MNRLNYDKFKYALMRLQERYEDYHRDHEHLEAYLLESVKESCIQRFEICIDTAWKHLKKHLEQEVGLVEIYNSPNMIFKSAQSAGILDNAELWIEFNHKRGDTSHDYSGEKAKKTFEVLAQFIQHAILLYIKITGETWDK